MRWFLVLLCLSMLAGCNPFRNKAVVEGEPCLADGDCADKLVCFNGVCVAELPEMDQDADGHTNYLYGGDDCDDRDRTVYGGAPELCDNKDNDCDEQTDEGLTSQPCVRSNEHGTCDGQQVCSPDGYWDFCQAPEPQAEACNGLDDNCDGQIDEGLIDRDCPLQDGVCAGSRQACLGAEGWSECDYGPDYHADQEVACDGLDEDCDGLIDDDMPPVLVAEDGDWAVDGVDNNCNGVVDEAGGIMVSGRRLDGSRFAVDAYEASLFENADCTGRQYAQDEDDYPEDFSADDPSDSAQVYACSLPGRVPSRFVSWHRAKRACEAVGKRLCTLDEYQRSCWESDEHFYPYGLIFVSSACNDAFLSSHTVAETGSRPQCSNGRTWDMSGNLTEWLSDSYLEPGFYMLAGWSFSPLVCQRGENCADFSNGSPDQILALEFMHKCIAPMEATNAFPPERARGDFGMRCCMDAE